MPELDFGRRDPAGGVTYAEDEGAAVIDPDRADGWVHAKEGRGTPPQRLGLLTEGVEEGDHVRVDELPLASAIIKAGRPVRTESRYPRAPKGQADCVQHGCHSQAEAGARRLDL